MAETFTWAEGLVYAWTGGAGATSALLAYAESVWAQFNKGYDNFQTLTGTYQDRYTGQRADLYLTTRYITDNSALRQMFENGTAVHMHLLHSGIHGSAGYYLYSGRIDGVDLNEREADIMRQSVTYHCNVWSAYG